MSMDDTMYYFIKNLQGDITKIVNQNGDVIIEYSYDHWGKVLSETVNSSYQPATIIKDFNPFRYRGYMYDTDTGLYYLQSRYYDPKTGCFINADSPEYTDTYSGSPLSTNMFAYCENNAINSIDPSGTDAVLLFQTDAVGIFGHAALIYQYKGSWYYFSVAYKEQNSDMIIDFVKLGKSLNAKKIKSINNAIKNNSKVKYKVKYTGTFYVKGNFKKSYSFCKKIYKTPEKYGVITNNCLKVAVRALNKGTCTGKNAQYYQTALIYLLGMTIPNKAYMACNFFKATYKNYYSKPWYIQIFMTDPYYYFFNYI